MIFCYKTDKSVKTLIFLGEMGAAGVHLKAALERVSEMISKSQVL